MFCQPYPPSKIVYVYILVTKFNLSLTHFVFVYGCFCLCETLGELRKLRSAEQSSVGRHVHMYTFQTAAGQLSSPYVV